MRKLDKAVGALALVGGLTASAVKILHKHDKKNNGVSIKITAVKHHKKHFGKHHHNDKVDAYMNCISHCYRNARSGKRLIVNGIVKMILPDRDHKMRDLRQYMKVLHYLTDRYEYHAKDASLQLDIPRGRAKRLTLAVSEQGLLEHTDAGANYVRQPQAIKIYMALKRTQYSHHRINKSTMRLLKNFTAHQLD